MEFNSRQGGIEFSQMGPDQFIVSNARSGLQLTVSADFDGCTVRYAYEQLNNKSAGVPEGGMLSMRQPSGGVVELYSADQQLTSEETRKVLLEPVLAPPRAA